MNFDRATNPHPADFAHNWLRDIPRLIYWPMTCTCDCLGCKRHALQMSLIQYDKTYMTQYFFLPLLHSPKVNMSTNNMSLHPFAGNDIHVTTCLNEF